MQEQLEVQLRQMNEFLATEERRSGIYLTEPPPDGDDGKPALTGNEYFITCFTDTSELIDFWSVDHFTLAENSILKLVNHYQLSKSSKTAESK